MLGGVVYPPAWAGGKSSAYFFSKSVLCLLSPALSISPTVIFSTWQQSQRQIPSGPSLCKVLMAEEVFWTIHPITEVQSGSHGMCFPLFQWAARLKHTSVPQMCAP